MMATIDDDGDERREAWNAVRACVLTNSRSALPFSGKGQQQLSTIFFLSVSVLPHFKVNATCDMRHATCDTSTRPQTNYQADVQLMKSLNHPHYGRSRQQSAGMRCVCAICYHNLTRFQRCLVLPAQVTSIDESHATVKV